MIEQQHRFSASLVDKKAQPYDMWSFHGSSYDWGKDDVVKLSRSLRAAEPDGRSVKGGYGGGIPVVAFWTGIGRRGGRPRGNPAADAVDCR